MSIRHLVAIAVPLIVCCDAAASTAAAQASLGPAKTELAAPRRALPDPKAFPPMEFYHAHGAANACGPDCNEWIAAEGKIDNDTADRLQRLLSRLHGARPPIFFHSPGGMVKGSMELGRLIRAHKMTTSVGHTMPLSCERGAKGERSCEAQIGAGRQIEAELGPISTTMCNSACVFALAGGVVRLIPPGVTLGIHDTGFDPAAAAKLRHASAQSLALAKATTHAQLRKYVRSMGIDEGLLTEAFATPFTSVGRLTRDDAARFGLDRREFAETEWQLGDKPRPAITKTFFVRTDNSERRYVNAVIVVSCTPSRVILGFSRERLSSDAQPAAGEPTAGISVNGQDIRLARTTSLDFYQRSAQLSLTFLKTVADTTIVLPGTEFGRAQGPSGDVTLAAAGFSTAYAKLRSACADQAQQALQSSPGTGAPQWPVSPTALQSLPSKSAPQWPVSPTALQSPPSASPPPLHPTPVGVGASRGGVDAVLGAPTETVGTTALYSDASSAGEGKVMAGYFDGSGRLQRFARYVFKDGKVFDEISETELSGGQELLPVRHLLGIPDGPDPNSRTVPPLPAASPGWPP